MSSGWEMTSSGDFTLAVDLLGEGLESAEECSCLLGLLRVVGRDGLDVRVVGSFVGDLDGGMRLT